MECNGSHYCKKFDDFVLFTAYLFSIERVLWHFAFVLLILYDSLLSYIFCEMNGQLSRGIRNSFSFYVDAVR